MLRWFAASAALPVPQAAGPVAFSLVAQSLTGEARGGAAMILAMTLAQVAGAIPITRLGSARPAATILRALLIFRMLALAALCLCAYTRAPFAWVIVFAALAGLGNGAASGYLRALLNHFTPSAGLPRALGIAATLNELTFVLGPVVASGLGAVSPVFSVVALTVLGSVPVLLIPRAPGTSLEDVPRGTASVLNRSILLWLACATAGGATVAAIEIGSVSLAIKFGFAPEFAILFTVPLCLASVSGGVWVSLRNRMASQGSVVAKLAVMTFGIALVTLGPSVATTMVGAVIIGIVLAPLGTYYSLVLDQLAPAHRRAEVFALLRTANATGVILASAVLTGLSLPGALLVVTGAMLAVTLMTGVVACGWRTAPRRGQPRSGGG